MAWKWQLAREVAEKKVKVTRLADLHAIKCLQLYITKSRTLLRRELPQTWLWVLWQVFTCLTVSTIVSQQCRILTNLLRFVENMCGPNRIIRIGHWPPTLSSWPTFSVTQLIRCVVFTIQLSSTSNSLCLLTSCYVILLLLSEDCNIAVVKGDNYGL